ncbi:MAG: hypothetical protein ACP5QX_06330 [Caldisericaceae bacterium]
MNKRGAGVAFCAISAFLFFAKYFFKVAIYVLENGTFMVGFDRGFLAINLTVNTFSVLSVIALIIGVIYIIAGEIEEKGKQ